MLKSSKLKIRNKTRMTGLVTPSKQHCKSQPGTAGKKRRQNTAKPDRAQLSFMFSDDMVTCRETSKDSITSCLEWLNLVMLQGKRIHTEKKSVAPYMPAIIYPKEKIRKQFQLEKILTKEITDSYTPN